MMEDALRAAHEIQNLVHQWNRHKPEAVTIPGAEQIAEIIEREGIHFPDEATPAAPQLGENQFVGTFGEPVRLGDLPDGALFQTSCGLWGVISRDGTEVDCRLQKKPAGAEIRCDTKVRRIYLPEPAPPAKSLDNRVWELIGAAAKSAPAGIREIAEALIEEKRQVEREATP